MNNLKGNIESVTTSGHLSLVKVNVSGITLSAIVIDTPESASYLKEGNALNVVFKETEVIVAKGTVAHQISLQNKILGKINHIESGELLSKVVASTNVGDVTSIITTNAVRQLQLNIGDEVTVMIKTNEIMLSE